MRVAMLLDKPFPPDPRVGNEMRSLVAAGHPVHLLCPLLDDGCPLEEEWEGARVHRIRMGRQFYKKMGALALRLPFYARAFRAPLARLVDREEIDAVHVHDLPLLASGLAVGEARGIPVIADLHENYPAAVATYDYAQRWPGRWLVSPEEWRGYETRCVPRAARVIVVVPEAAERFRGRIAPEKIQVVSNTVHVDEFEGFPRDPAIEARFRDRFTIGYLGGFDRHRGLETVLDAFAEIAPEMPDAHLLLVGTGATHAGLVARARALGIDARTSFEGWQDYRLFPSYVGACQVCLIPHRKSEHTDTTIPHKLFHYMLLERPVVATDCRPIARILEETGAGLVHRSEDASALARCLRQLRDRELSARLGAAGRRAVLDRYNWARTSEALLDLYASLRATA